MMKNGFLVLILLVSVWCEQQLIQSQDYQVSQGGVFSLTNDNFDQALQQYSNMLVKFFAPWCGHCKKIAPIFEKASDMMPDKIPVIFAEVDCTIHSVLCSKHEIKGYPSVLLFKTSQKEPLKYTSERTEDAINNWLLDNIDLGNQQL